MAIRFSEGHAQGPNATLSDGTTESTSVPVLAPLRGTCMVAICRTFTLFEKYYSSTGQRRRREHSSPNKKAKDARSRGMSSHARHSQPSSNTRHKVSGHLARLGAFVAQKQSLRTVHKRFEKVGGSFGGAANHLPRDSSRVAAQPRAATGKLTLSLPQRAGVMA